jgi:hypothetical protein
MKATDQELTHVQHAKWRISFLYSDLERLGQKDREEMKYKIYESVRDSNLQGNDLDPLMLDNLPGSPGDFVSRIDDAGLLSIQRESKRVLEGFIESGVWQERRFRSPTIWCTSFDGAKPYRISVKLEGDVVAQAVLALMLHVTYSRQTRDRLNHCDNCGIIFLRSDRKPQKGRGVYHSASCAQAAAMKRFRAKADVPAAESEAKIPSSQDRLRIERVLRQTKDREERRGRPQQKADAIARPKDQSRNVTKRGKRKE